MMLMRSLRPKVIRNVVQVTELGLSAALPIIPPTGTSHSCASLRKQLSDMYLFNTTQWSQEKLFSRHCDNNPASFRIVSLISVLYLLGFHRHAAPVTRRQFPHGAHRMDYLHFEDDSRGWWFDMDMVIIYIYSVNWVIGFVVFCFLCYFFFPF